MTEQVLKQIVQRAVRDGTFRAQLKRDPASALAGFKLTEEERSALTSGDPARLTALGVDQRTSKALAIGGIGGLFMSVQPDLVAREASFDDQGSADVNTIVGDPAAPVAAVRIEPGQSANATHMRLVEQDLNVANSAVIAAAVPADGGSMNAFNLRRIEQDLDAAAAAKADDADSANAINLRRIEQDLDVTKATNLDLPAPDPDTNLTEY